MDDTQAKKMFDNVIINPYEALGKCGLALVKLYKALDYPDAHNHSMEIIENVLADITKLEKAFIIKELRK